MARALIVGCGCRGRELGVRLLADGWQVRGTSREWGRLAELERARIEPALADPDRAATVLDHVGDVAVVLWLLGSARGDPERLAAVNGPRLERVLERLVESPVRGFAYEAAGTVGRRELARGAELVRAAGERWRIPVAVLEQDPEDWRSWCKSALEATRRLVAS